jgi:hypothetical protein
LFLGDTLLKVLGIRSQGSEEFPQKETGRVESLPLFNRIYHILPLLICRGRGVSTEFAYLFLPGSYSISPQLPFSVINHFLQIVFKPRYK